MQPRALCVAALCVAFSSPALAYNVRTTSKGAPLRWPAGKLPVEVSLEDAPEGVGAHDAEAAAVAAFATYTDVLGKMAPDVDLALATTDDALVPEGDDGKNVVRWVKKDWAASYDPGALAVTLTSYDPSSGAITDADIVVNAADYSWTAKASSSNCKSAYDLQNVLTHEAGHLFGLAHDKDDPDATMYPSSGMCETKKRDLDTDDVAGLAHLYVDTVAPPASETGPRALGCAVGDGGAGPSALVGTLLVAALLVGRRRPRLAVIVGMVALAVGAFSLPPLGRATTLRQLSLDDMSADAAVVARGVVGAVVPVRVGGHVYTDATLVISECLKGGCPATVTVRQLGGEVDGFGVHVEGTAELAPAGEVVLLLRRRLDGAFAPLGMAQGAFRVERDPATLAIRSLVRDGTALHFAKPDGTQTSGAVERLTMDDLRASIARAAAR